MDRNTQPVINPFALLMDPDTIFRAIERSERLGRLHSRICRPLDRPMLPPNEATAAKDAEPGVDAE